MRAKCGSPHSEIMFFCKMSHMKAALPIHKTPSSCQSAFTLVEVMMGTAVMVVVFVTIFGVMTEGLFVTQTSRENLRATQIMVDKMEGIRLFSPTQLTNNAFLLQSFTNWFCETNNIGMPNVQGYGVMYTGTIAISNVLFSTSYTSNMQQVTINISWVSTGQGNIAHSRSMSTFYANQGLYNYVWTNGY
jgi:type II secretory pathway pseudopilin PulG